MPMNFNLAPDDEPRIIERSTGPRREPAVSIGRPTCHRCGKDCFDIYSLADVGVFCSARCRAAVTDEAPRPLVTVCAWCPDAAERTASARAHGFDVSHGMCATHAATWGDER